MTPSTSTPKSPANATGNAGSAWTSAVRDRLRRHQAAAIRTLIRMPAIRIRRIPTKTRPKMQPHRRRNDVPCADCPAQGVAAEAGENSGAVAKCGQNARRRCQFGGRECLYPDPRRRRFRRGRRCGARVLDLSRFCSGQPQTQLQQRMSQADFCRFLRTAPTKPATHLLTNAQ